MLQISEIVKQTEDMFDLFNGHFYNGELTRPAITVSPDGGRGAYGWCSINEIWNAEGELYREINLCAEYLDRPIFELAATLLHEMTHLYNLVQEVQDVSNNGYYHNMKFKATAEAHGLIIEKHQKYGWTVTKLAPEAEAWIKATLGEASIKASRLQMEGGSKGGSKKSINRSIKYVTLAQFLRYVRQQCEKKGIYMEIDREEFENPYRPESYSYTVVNGEKKCHSAKYITTKSLRRKLASYQTSEGFTRYYYSDELEEYEETKLHRYDWTVDGTDTPCEAETIRSFPYDHQIYILNWDGSMYNEICEFTFDDEKTSHGYYYQANRDAQE